MDFAILEANISCNKYLKIQDFSRDVRLLFVNARRTESPSSTVLQDAQTLEKVFAEQIRATDPSRPKIRHGSSSTASSSAKKRLVCPKKYLTEVELLRMLFQTVRQHKDERGRELATSIFRLPTLQLADGSWTPAPFDLEKVEAKLLRGEYRTLDSITTDIRDSLDNAVKVGTTLGDDSGAQFIKDATVLLQVALQRKFQLTFNAEGCVPDIRGAVQQIFEQLVRDIMTYSDEDDRLLSDTLHELPAKEQDGTTAATLDHVFALLQSKEHYKRLDSLQEDVFAVLKRARVLSRTDSQVRFHMS